MRIFFLLPAICLISKSPQTPFSNACQTDTAIVTHLLDGSIAEWPAEKFMTDKATKMEYALDNNNQTLFLAIKVADQNVQKRIMQEGLHLYLDTKGKKKESRGIEFPLKMENLASIEYMKLFGFGSGEPATLSIRSEGTANIAIAWDSSFVMHIEYHIPLKMLEEIVADLNNKKISIGWKLEQSEIPSTASQTVTRTSSEVVAVRGTSRPGNRNASNVNNTPVVPSTSSKAQSVWTTHTISF